MSEKPKRRFFQIHLSTAIVLMFVAGGLMWFDFYVIRIVGGEFKDNMVVRIFDLALIDGFCFYCIGVSFEKIIRRREARKL